jgi:hypothetical protein
LTYVSDYSEGEDGILYKKVKEEDEHVFRILTTEDLSKEVRDPRGLQIIIKVSILAIRPCKTCSFIVSQIYFMVLSEVIV